MNPFSKMKQMLMGKKNPTVNIDSITATFGKDVPLGITDENIGISYNYEWNNPVPDNNTYMAIKGIPADFTIEGIKVEPGDILSFKNRPDFIVEWDDPGSSLRFRCSAPICEKKLDEHIDMSNYGTTYDENKIQDTIAKMWAYQNGYIEGVNVSNLGLEIQKLSLVDSSTAVKLEEECAPGYPSPEDLFFSEGSNRQSAKIKSIWLSDHARYHREGYVFDTNKDDGIKCEAFPMLTLSEKNADLFTLMNVGDYIRVNSFIDTEHDTYLVYGGLDSSGCPRLIIDDRSPNALKYEETGAWLKDVAIKYHIDPEKIVPPMTPQLMKICDTVKDMVRSYIYDLYNSGRDVQEAGKNDLMAIYDFMKSVTGYDMKDVFEEIVSEIMQNPEFARGGNPMAEPAQVPVLEQDVLKLPELEPITIIGDDTQGIFSLPPALEQDVLKLPELEPFTIIGDDTQGIISLPGDECDQEKINITVTGIRIPSIGLDFSEDSLETILDYPSFRNNPHAFWIDDRTKLPNEHKVAYYDGSAKNPTHLGYKSWIRPLLEISASYSLELQTGEVLTIGNHDYTIISGDDVEGTYSLLCNDTVMSKTRSCDIDKNLSEWIKQEGFVFKGQPGIWQESDMDADRDWGRANSPTQDQQNRDETEEEL